MYATEVWIRTVDGKFYCINQVDEVRLDRNISTNEITFMYKTQNMNQTVAESLMEKLKKWMKN